MAGWRESHAARVTESLRFSLQVMFRKTGYIYGKVYITGWHFMDFPMPQLGDYELMVRGRYEGGDGPVRKIRIQGTVAQGYSAKLNTAQAPLSEIAKIKGLPVQV